MKRLFMMFVAGMMLFPTTMFAQKELTAEQNQLQNSLYTFLKEEGYMPEYDSDGDIKFKSEGKTYYFIVSETNKNPMYVTLRRYFDYPENISVNTFVMATKALNLYKGVKVVCFDESYAIGAELFVRSANPVKEVFYKLISQIDGVKNDVLSECEKVSGSSSYVTNNSLMNLFFPVYGFELGKVTTREFQSKGYKVETIDSGSHNCTVHGLTFWDHDKNNIFEDIYFTKWDDMPTSWSEDVGLNWSLSYNQIKLKFQNLGFIVNVIKSPSTETYSGRKTLSAKLEAISPDQKLEFQFVFNYGNRNGEGYNQNSQNSLYSISIETD